MRKFACITTTQAGRARRRERVVCERDPEEMHFLVSCCMVESSFPCSRGGSAGSRYSTPALLTPEMAIILFGFCVLPFAQRVSQASLGGAYMGPIQGLTAVAWIGVGCKTSTCAGLAGLLPSLYPFKPTCRCLGVAIPQDYGVIARLPLFARRECK